MNNTLHIQKLLSAAITDYPLGISTTKELLSELYKKLESPITLNNLERYLSTIDVSKNTWEAESISSLLQLFEGYEEHSLEQIIDLSGMQ
jgi:hypothetical protein